MPSESSSSSIAERSMKTVTLSTSSPRTAIAWRDVSLLIRVSQSSVSTEGNGAGAKAGDSICTYPNIARLTMLFV
jgi:hypothetical protein